MDQQAPMNQQAPQQTAETGPDGQPINQNALNPMPEVQKLLLYRMSVRLTQDDLALLDRAITPDVGAILIKFLPELEPLIMEGSQMQAMRPMNNMNQPAPGMEAQQASPQQGPPAVSGIRA